MFRIFKKKEKKPKPVTIYGRYDGSHPDFPTPVLAASLTCDETGVTLSFDKGGWSPVKHFKWEDLDGFDFNTNSGRDLTDSRVSATRVVAFGVVGAMAKKKTYEDYFLVHNVLYTKSGNIDLILERVSKITGDASKTAAGLDRTANFNKSSKFKKLTVNYMSSQKP